LIGAAVQRAKIVRHFLEAEHIGIGERLRTDTIRARSAQPFPHWIFQVNSRISECPPA
jgi:hypothetical protein